MFLRPNSVICLQNILSQIVEPKMNVNVCRVCLCKPETFQNIFSDDEEETEATVVDLFATLLGLKVVEEESKSKVICESCLDKLRSLNEFRQQAHKAEEQWRRCEVKDEEHVEEKIDTFEAKVESDSESPVRSSKRVSKRNYDERDEEIKNFYDLACYDCPADPHFDSFAEYKKHARDVHDEKNPAIVCCNIRLTKRYSLLEHKDFHTHSKELKCPICDKMYSKRDILAFHIKQMHGSDQDRPYQCEKCQKRFVRIDNLRAHMKSHLSKEEKAKLKVHKCDECDVMFSSVYNLNNHKKFKHLGLMAFFCPGCAKHYKSRYDFEIHRRNIHGEEGPERAQCHLCSKWFSHEKSLKVHIRDTHNEQPGPHVCKSCGHRTKSRQALRSHIKMRHEERRFHCSFCEKAFQTARQLREHTTVHVGGSLFSCAYCDRKFNSNSNMYKHLKAVHTEDWDKEKKARAMNPHPLSTRGKIVLKSSE